MSLKQNLISLFRDATLDGKSLKQICNILGISQKFEQRALSNVLLELEQTGEIVRLGSVYRYTEYTELIKGVLRGNERGFAFLISDKEGQKDLFLPHHALKSAQHGDTVLVRPVTDSRRGSDDEGEVVKVLSRGYRQIVGTYYTERSFGFVRPDERKYYSDVYVPFAQSSRARAGDKVVVKITGYDERRGYPYGEVTEILGRQFDLGAERLSVVRAHGLRTEFPEETLLKAERQAKNLQISPDRKDFRSDVVITIDGADAKDLDDAVCVQKTENGYRLFVHIADVSEYVVRGGAIDKEARLRGTSVYFPDGVIPMLPTALCNGICSLNEGENRLTLSCIMDIDRKGKTRSVELTEGVIKSCYRMTYDGVQRILDGIDTAQNQSVQRMLFDMQELAEILIAERKTRGNIDLDVAEAQITVDADGEIDVAPYQRTFAHRIIEAFMLAANEAVASYVSAMELPFVYRVHDRPVPEKLQTFLLYLKGLGITATIRGETARPYDYEKILSAVQGTPLFSVVNRVMLRSMAKAKYSTENLGHFGLASECYCHFTSPIRRYPDLMVHRVIKEILRGNIGEVTSWGEDYADGAKTSSETERTAEEAERDVDDLYKLRWAHKRLGAEFDGVISGVSSHGVFVELPNTVEGMVRLQDLPRGRYEYDEGSMTLKSNRFTFKIGESIRVKVVGSDYGAKRVEFSYVSKAETL